MRFHKLNQKKAEWAMSKKKRLFFVRIQLLRAYAVAELAHWSGNLSNAERKNIFSPGSPLIEGGNMI